MLLYQQTLHFLRKYALGPPEERSYGLDFRMPFADVRLDAPPLFAEFVWVSQGGNFFECRYPSRLGQLCLEARREWADVCSLSSIWHTGFLGVTIDTVPASREPWKYGGWSELCSECVVRAGLDVIRGEDCLEKFVDFALDNDNGRNPDRTRALELVAKRLNQLREGAPA